MKIVLIGAESTGKSTLTKQLALFYKTTYFEEYARHIAEVQNNVFSFEDVENIAKVQISELQSVPDNSEELIFFDTDLIITKVWFAEVFRKLPQWFPEALLNNLPDLYLLCDTDMPWEADVVRTAGPVYREVLQKIYIKEIENSGIPFRLVHGIGDERFENAKLAVNEFISELVYNKSK